MSRTTCTTGATEAGCRRRPRGPRPAVAARLHAATTPPTTDNDLEQPQRRRHSAVERQRRARREGHHRLLRPRRPTTAGSPPITNSAAGRGREVLATSSCKVAEGTNDVNLQISQVETFINDKVDAIVLLPIDGAALTEVATKAMEAGIPVINVDREFSSPFAARTTVLGDNYGMGVSRRHLHLRAARATSPNAGRRRDRRHRLAAADPGPQPRASRTR